MPTGTIGVTIPSIPGIAHECATRPEDTWPQFHRARAGLRSPPSASCLSGRLSASRSPAAEPQPTDVKRLYDTSCASCHGIDGRGTARPPMPSIRRRGTSRAASYKFRSTASGSLPTDDDLYRAIEDGLPGTSMLGWKGILSDAQIRALVVYVKQFSPRFATERPAPVAATPQIAATPESIAEGASGVRVARVRRVPRRRRHGRGRGDAAAGRLGPRVYAPNLTEPWTFRGGRTAADIYLRLKTGINGTPMPSFADTAKDQDLWHVANYIVSLARKPVWEMDRRRSQGALRQRPRETRPTPSSAGGRWWERWPARIATRRWTRGPGPAGHEVRRRREVPHRGVGRRRLGQPHLGQRDGARPLRRRGHQAGGHAGASSATGRACCRCRWAGPRTPT